MFENLETGRIYADVQGYPQTMVIWAQIAPALAMQIYRVVCADLRGHAHLISHQPSRIHITVSEPWPESSPD